MFNKRYFSVHYCCFLFLFTTVLLIVFGSSLEAVDFGLIEALHGKNPLALQQYAATYRNTPIEPYIFAARINARDAAKGSLSAAISQGLERFAGIPPIERLRASLLKEWARSGDWTQFETHSTRIPLWLKESDTELQCAMLIHARVSQNQSAVSRADLFEKLREFPPLCTDAFSGVISSGEIAKETALNKLVQIATFGSRASGLRLQQMLSNEPESIISVKASAVVEILHAARDSFSDGKKQLAAYDGVLDTALRRLVTTHVGLLGARKHEHESHDLIRSVDGYRIGVSAAAAAWRTRAAIMAGAWDDVLASILSLPPEMRREPFQHYWQARALQKLSQTEAARALFVELAQQPGYYGLLAAEHAGIRPPYLNNAPLPDYTLIKTYLNRPEVKRALALHQAGLWSEAALEWKYLMLGADSASYYAAAHAAKAQGLVDQQISLAVHAAQHFDLQLRYPLVHTAEVLSASESAHIPAELTWAIIRQESRFVPHAISSSGAVGLMQLMPATAKLVAARSGIKTKPTRQMLIAPETNITLGTTFLGSLFRSYGENAIYTAAAYNAGPGRIKKWRSTLGAIDLERFVELIPFDETREYTKQVLSNYVFYSYARNTRLVRLSHLLAQKP